MTRDHSGNAMSHKTNLPVESSQSGLKEVFCECLRNLRAGVRDSLYACSQAVRSSLLLGTAVSGAALGQLMFGGVVVATLSAPDRLMAQPGGEEAGERPSRERGGNRGPGGGNRAFGGGFGGGGFGGFGGGRGTPGLAGMVLRDNVRQEIGISDEQAEELRKLIFEGNQFDFGSIRDRMSQAETDEDRAKIQEEIRLSTEKRRKETEAKIKQMLKPEQFERLEQLTLHEVGYRALRNEDTAAAFKLTEDQKKKIQEISDAYDQNMRGGFFSMSTEDREKARLARDAELEKVLSADQKKQWTAKIGPAPKIAAAPDERGRDGGRRRDRGGLGGAPTFGPPGSIPNEKPPEGETVIADLSVKSDSTKPEAETTIRGEKVLSFNFRYAPWEMVLKSIAQHAGLTLDLNVTPPGTFNYLDDGKFTVTQAIDIINGYLSQKGFLLVRRDKFLVVVNTEGGVPPNLVPQVAMSSLQERGRFELVSVLMPLDGLDPEIAADEAQSLLGPQGKIVPLSRAGRLLVTDFASNIIRIDELLNGFRSEPTSAPTFQPYQLKHVSVMEGEKVVRDLFGLPQRNATSSQTTTTTSSRRDQREESRGDWGSRGWGGREGGWGGWGGRDRDGSDQNRGNPPGQQTAAASNGAGNVAGNGRIQVATDLRTNTLMVTAKPEDHKIIEAALKTLDVDDKTNNLARNLTGRNTPQLEVYPVNTADTQVLIETIGNLVPAAIINEDTKAKRLHVFATADEQAQIKALIHQIDGGIEGGETSLVVHLRKHDALAAAGTLRNLFRANANNRDDVVPMIEPDAIGRRLLVRGTTNQVAEIRAFLKDMGEDPDGTGVDTQARGNVRSLPLGGRDPQEFAELLQKLWPHKTSNPIRIVVPSASTLKSSRDFPAGAALPNRDVGERSGNGVVQTKTIDSDQRFLPQGIDLQQVEDALNAKTLDQELEEATAEPTLEANQRPSTKNPSSGLQGSEAAKDQAKPTAEGAEKTEIQPDANQEFSESDDQTADDTPPQDLTPGSKVEIETKPASGSKSAGELNSTSAPTASGKQNSESQSEELSEKPLSSNPSAPAGESNPAKGKSPALGHSTSSDEPLTPNGKPARRIGNEDGQGLPDPRKDMEEENSKDSLSERPLLITPAGNNLILTSDDMDALDQLQQIAEALATTAPKKTSWTVFYLRTADATETASMLGHLFPSGSISQSTDSGSSTFMGSLTGGISSMGSSLMDMTGLSSLGAANALRIVPEIRSNALFVTGPSDLVAQVEDVLKVLDASELPESLRDRVPRMIPVEHADVDEVATVIESVYKDYMQAPAAVPGGGGGGGGFNPIAMLMAAGGGGDGKQKRGIRLTIGVDARTNSIVVSADEALFRQVETLIKSLDAAALDANRTIRVINVSQEHSQLVSRALSSMLGKVKVSTTRDAPGSMPENNSPMGQNSDPRSSRTGRGGSSGSGSDDDLRRAIESRMRDRFLQGAGIVPPGGGGNQSGRSGFGGDRGSRRRGGN